MSGYGRPDAVSLAADGQFVARAGLEGHCLYRLTDLASRLQKLSRGILKPIFSRFQEFYLFLEVANQTGANDHLLLLRQESA